MSRGWDPDDAVAALARSDRQLARAIARAALRVLVEEGMIDNAATLGPYFLELLAGISSTRI